jgi:hypothetical protein
MIDKPDAYTDSRTHSGTGIYMTAGVHCCDCWRFGEEQATLKQRIAIASDIVQASGTKGTPSYRAAEKFLAEQLGD